MGNRSLPPSREFVTFDVMRGIAALGVLALHCGPLLGPWLTPGSAYLAVDLFFILSGFVLAFAYSDRLHSNLSAAKFLQARIIRIYPLFALGILFGTFAEILMLLTGSKAWTPAQIARDTVTSLLLIPSFPWDTKGVFRNNLFPLSWPAWSLFYELVINIVFAFLPLRRWPHLMAVATVSGVALVGLAVSQRGLSGGVHYNEIGAGLIRVTFGFFAGVALYSLHRRRRPGSIPPANAILAVTALLLFMPITEVLRPWYDAACVLIAFPTAVYWGAAVLRWSRLLGQFGG